MNRPNAALADLSRYYDALHVWTRLSAGFRSFSGWEAGTVHRWLVHPESGDFSPATIHELMLAAGLGDPHAVDALDAGCGYGGTMFALHAALGGRWHGITISGRQFAQGRGAARRKGLGDAVTFSRQSYDAPLARPYSLIYAIESLIHSAAPDRTIRNLAAALRPGGTFVLVDDMPVEQVPVAAHADLARFKASWRCPVMPSAGQLSSFFEQAGCEILDVRDLTPLTRPRSLADLAAAMDNVDRQRRWRDRLGLRSIGEAETGGLLLEKLACEAVVRYTMIRARKRG